MNKTVWVIKEADISAFRRLASDAVCGGGAAPAGATVAVEGPQEPRAEAAEDVRGKSPVSAACNCMNYVIDIDGVPRESPERAGLLARIEACQHVLRICAPQRVHDLLQGGRMELNVDQVVSCGGR